ncbi:hypothetical protein Tco_1495872, partial [Tanacetum coccineum]
IVPQVNNSQPFVSDVRALAELEAHEIRAAGSNEAQSVVVYAKGIRVRMENELSE